MVLIDLIKRDTFLTQGSGAVTHSSKQAEFSLQFQWQPTADTTGPVIFV